MSLLIMMTKLKHFYCSVNDIKSKTNNLNNLKGIENLTNLITLSCARCNIDSLEYISQLKNLSTLNISNNSLENLDDIENMLNLEIVSLDGNDKLTTLKGIEKTNSLYDITIYQCKSLPEELKDMSFRQMQDYYSNN